MTGVHELRTTQVVSAAPETIRVSVVGGGTQLDVGLPADVPVAAFLPELAQLVGSREARRDDEAVDRDERRTFWVLSRITGGAELAPEDTLRTAGVGNGELLSIEQRRALSPPTLYDDVVDAAARLNRASYAAWDATAAAVMAIAGIWSCTAVWMYFLAAAPLSIHPGFVVGGAVLVLVTLVGGAALVRRALGRTDIAVAAGLPVLALSGALGWTLAERFGPYGLAAACAVLLILAAVYHRVIGAGRWAYIAAGVVYGLGACALLASAWGARLDVVAVGAGVTAAVACLAVPGLTASLRRAAPPASQRRHRRQAHAFDPFPVDESTDSGTAMPSAEDVWARVRSMALTRTGLLAGLGVVVATATAVLLHAQTSWPAFIFALVCAAVLALRSRAVATVPERAALALPAAALVLIACALAQAGAESLRLGGVVVLALTGVVSALLGLVAGDRLPDWVPAAAVYLEYIAVAVLIPVALWPLGIYGRLGL